jgi:hypothetical protein
MTHDVFICHSSHDKTVADAACAVLEQRGIRCWIAPRDILPGASWAGSIVTAIETSRVMLLIFSGNANTSPQIEREVERAVNHRIPTVPFRIEDIMPTAAMEYFISASHWLDAYSPPINRHYQTLADKIEALLAASPAPEDGVQHDPAAPSHSDGAAERQAAPARKPVVGLPLIIAGVVVLAIVLAGVGVVVTGLGVVLAGRARAVSPPAVAAASGGAPSAPAPSPAGAPAPQLAFLNYPINLDASGDNWVALRSEPNGQGVRLDMLGPNAQFRVLESQGQWSRVAMPDGRTGWVANHFIGCCRAAPN